MKFLKFKTLAMGAIAVASISGTVIGVDYAWENHQQSKIVEIESSIEKINPSKMLGLIQKEKLVTEQFYSSNKELFKEYLNHKEIITILKMEKAVDSRDGLNEKFHNAAIKSLDKDAKAIEEIIAATSSSTNLETKQEMLLEDSPELTTLKKWGELSNSTTYMYAKDLIDLEKRTKEHLNFLTKAKTEIINTVKEKINNKDYNLSATEAALIKKVSKDIKLEIKGLENIKQELRGTEQEVLLTDKDLAQSKEAMNELKKEAEKQIAKDKEKIESLVNSDSSNWGLFQYYLLYNWLAGGSSSSPAAMSFVNNKTLDNPIQNRLAQVSSSQYDIKEPTSQINKMINHNSGKVGGVNLNKSKLAQVDILKVQQKIEQTRQKAINASNLHKQEVARKIEVTRIKNASSQTSVNYASPYYKAPNYSFKK